MITDSKEFIITLIEFYKESLCNSSATIKKLSELQRKFPENYDQFKKISLDPNVLPEVLAKLDDESRGILVDIYFKQDTLTRKTNLLLQMTADEKDIFAKELEDFGKLVDEKIKKLIKKDDKDE